MARPNVTVIVNDQSFVIAGTESGGAHRAGFPDVSGADGTLLFVLGTTTEREEGFMVVESTNDWFGRLKSTSPIKGSIGTTLAGTIPFIHGTANNQTGGNQFAGGTFQRWPAGPTGTWQDAWYSVQNYLQYGGVAVVGSTGSGVGAASTAQETLKNKSIALDSVFGSSGSVQNTLIQNVVEARGDCIGVCHVPSSTTINTSVNTPVNSSSENIISVFGEKLHVDVNRLASGVVTDSDLIQTPLSSDVAGCLSRTDRIANPWFSPGGATRGRILDVVRLAKDLSDVDQDTLYDNKVNPVVTFPGEGTILFGDKTNKTATSTLSRINVARLFLYLKRVIGTSARSLLFEQNDDITRNLFINAVTPLLETIRGQRGITDFRVICDESNNTSDIVDSNQFVADIFIKPTKSINFIRLRFTNKSEGAELG